jgi:hypothetical protein
MNTINKKINHIILALMELETNDYHSVCFEYGSDFFRVRIFAGEVNRGNIVYQKTFIPTEEAADLDELSNKITSLKSSVTTTIFQCYRRVFVKGERAGKWEKIRPIIPFGENALTSMLYDGSGYFLDDPDNNMQYFVDMKQVSETN